MMCLRDHRGGIERQRVEARIEQGGNLSQRGWKIDPQGKNGKMRRSNVSWVGSQAGGRMLIHLAFTLLYSVTSPELLALARVQS